MKLTIKQRKKLINDFNPSSLVELKGRNYKGIYKLDLGDEKLYFFAVKRQEYNETSFRSILLNLNDEALFNRLIKIKFKGNYFKKILFVVGDNFHWLSI